MKLSTIFSIIPSKTYRLENFFWDSIYTCLLSQQQVLQIPLLDSQLSELFAKINFQVHFDYLLSCARSDLNLNSQANRGSPSQIRQYIPNLDTISTLCDRLAVESVKGAHIVTRHYLGKPVELEKNKFQLQSVIFAEIGRALIAAIAQILSEKSYHFVSEYRTFDMVKRDFAGGGIAHIYKEICCANRLTGIYDYSRMELSKSSLAEISLEAFVQTELNSRYYVERRGSLRTEIDESVVTFLQLND